MNELYDNALAICKTLGGGWPVPLRRGKYIPGVTKLSELKAPNVTRWNSYPVEPKYFADESTSRIRYGLCLQLVDVLDVDGDGALGWESHEEMFRREFPYAVKTPNGYHFYTAHSLADVSIPDWAGPKRLRTRNMVLCEGSKIKRYGTYERLYGYPEAVAEQIQFLRQQ